MDLIWWFFLQGESFYNPYIPKALELLNEKGLIEESEGARVIFIEGKKIPLIVVKRDGGFNYASTDLAALWLVLVVNCVSGWTLQILLIFSSRIHVQWLL